MLRGVRVQCKKATLKATMVLDVSGDCMTTDGSVTLALIVPHRLWMGAEIGSHRRLSLTARYARIATQEELRSLQAGLIRDGG